MASALPALPSPPLASEDQTPKSSRGLQSADLAFHSPPSSFTSSARKARKRTSDEFELDQAGTLVSKRVSSSVSKDKVKDDLRASTRKHRSLNVSTSSNASSRDTRTRERRRESLGLAITSPTNKSERHSRQSSVGSAPSQADPSASRRVHTTDFSHLPPSPSSSSIQHILRQAAHASPASNQSSRKENPPGQPSPSVAHSLLRGTQEGWSGLDDEATAEALRKLDGLGGKTARSRASLASLGRTSSSSRPGTPSGKSQHQWEGMNMSDSAKSKRSSTYVRSDKESGASLPASGSEGMARDPDSSILSSDDPVSYPEKTPKKQTRLSFTPKRGSTSSTTYASTPTTSSRDSATTNATSISAASGRQSSSKNRRNSAGSDISSVHSSDATLLKDRAAHIAANGEASEDAEVPPVPPLPKDFSSYRSPPTTASNHVFPSLPCGDEPEARTSNDGGFEKISLEVPVIRRTPPAQSYLQPTTLPSTVTVEPPPVILKTPSKKWSFSSALNLKLSSSPSSSSQKSSGFPLSPRSVTFGHGLRKSASKDKNSASSSKAPWSPQPDAMSSANSLASISSVGSVRNHATTGSAKTPDKNATFDRPDTGSSNNTTSALSAPPTGALSPTTSVKRAQSKRLTPSSIPFFRRSSSQSMQLPSSSGSGTAPSPPPPPPPISKRTVTPSNDTSTSISTPASTHRKSSVLSLGLPSLLKSTSRRSLHGDSKEGTKEQKAKDAARESEKEKAKSDKEKSKKDDKDRSESRISVLMGRKRGKVCQLNPRSFYTSLCSLVQTLSSTDPRKPKSPVNLPPMQIAAIEPVTAQRVAKLKSSSSQSPATSSVGNRTSTSSSRLTSHTVSSMQKQSDSSLRSRHQLPTIAGSPSVGTNGTNSVQTVKDYSQSGLINSVSGLPKETPTKIPRISSRTSAAASPPLKVSSSMLPSRRTSINTATASSSTNPSPISTSEFGVLASDDGATPKHNSATLKQSVRGSPSSSVSRPPRQSSATTTAPSTNAIPRKSARDSVSFIGLRKASTSSVNSQSTPASGAESSSQHRFSALSPSKGLKLIGPKSTPRSSNSSSQTSRQNMASPSSSRQSLSTPSPAPSSVDEDELMGDEEMMHYIRRQQAKKLAAGATQEELDELLKFPEPIPPTAPASPTGQFFVWFSMDNACIFLPHF